jgi:hypothetical protein
MDLGGMNWVILDIVGPLLLVAVIAWAVLRNRASRGDRDRSERATRDLYRDEEERRQRGDDGAS